jgi:hypothetical protein
VFGDEEKERFHVREKRGRVKMKSNSPKSSYDLCLDESWPLDQIVKRLQDEILTTHPILATKSLTKYLDILMVLAH